MRDVVQGRVDTETATGFSAGEADAATPRLMHTDTESGFALISVLPSYEISCEDRQARTDLTEMHLIIYAQKTKLPRAIKIPSITDFFYQVIIITKKYECTCNLLECHD